MAYRNYQDLWFINHMPAAATQATIARAAGAAGVRHVAKRLIACAAAGANAITPLNVVIRDGATGAGTVLAAWTVATIANGLAVLDIDNLFIRGTAATIMTAEFSAAGVAASVCSITLIGFDE